MQCQKLGELYCRVCFNVDSVNLLFTTLSNNDLHLVLFISVTGLKGRLAKYRWCHFWTHVDAQLWGFYLNEPAVRHTQNRENQFFLLSSREHKMPTSDGCVGTDWFCVVTAFLSMGQHTTVSLHISFITVPDSTDRRKIRLIEGNEKWRYLKKLTSKRTLRQVFICLRPTTP